MDTSFTPGPPAVTTRVDGVPAAESNWVWETNGTVRWQVPLPYPAVSLTVEFRDVIGRLRSSEGVLMVPTGEENIFVPPPPLVEY